MSFGLIASYLSSFSLSKAPLEIWDGIGMPSFYLCVEPLKGF